MKPFLIALTTACALTLGTAAVAAENDIANEADAAAAAAAIEPASTNSRYSPVGGPSDLTLGQLIAYRITDPDLSEFKKAMEAATISKKFNPADGYTVFAPINGEFDPKEHPMEHYILNKRFSLETFEAAYDTEASLDGEDIPINRAANKSYFIDDMRVNGVDRNPEGTVYKVGGWQDAPHL